MKVMTIWLVNLIPNGGSEITLLAPLMKMTRIEVTTVETPTAPTDVNVMKEGDGIGADALTSLKCSCKSYID